MTNTLLLDKFDDLSAWQVSDRKEVRILPAEAGGPCLEWKSRERGATTLVRDFTPLKDRLAGFDAICLDYWQDGDLSLGSLTLENLPGYDRARDWYFKFSHRHDRAWRTARFELPLDDDSPENGKDPRTLARFVFATQSRTITGPSVWRIRNLRAVRYPVRVDYDEAKKSMEETADAYRYRYAISVRNADANDHECSLMFDRSELKRFLLEAPASPFTVKGGESRTVDVVLSIPKKAAVDLPSLYTESIPFVLKVQGLEESDVPVLRGWQDLPLFATVPPRYAGNGRPRVRCDANRLIQLGAWVKTDAAFSNAFAWFRAAADSALRRPAAVPKEKGVFLGDRQNADDAFYCALVYALTGETRYRARARDTLLTYAAIPPLKPRTGGNATGYANVMGGSLLEEAYAKGLPWAYDFLMASGGLSKSESQKIEEDLLLPMLKSMGRHHTGYTAQTSEYISQELACALVCGHWSMAGRALHGDFGFYDMLDNAFDAAGWTRENNLALNVIQGMTVTPMILMAESADGVGINAFGNSKFQTILKNAGMGSFPPTGPSGPGPNTTLRPCPMSSYPESQSWFFGHPRP